jgi:hypothetical protein
VLDSLQKVMACDGQISETKMAKSLRIMGSAKSLRGIDPRGNFEHLIGQDQRRSQLTARKRACP